MKMKIKVEKIILFIVLSLLVLFLFNSIRNDTELKEKVVLLDEKASPMPEMSTPMYFTESNLKVRHIVSSEHVFLKTKKELTNLSKKDINIELIYNDLAQDINNVKQTLSETIFEIQELNPKEEKTKRSQEDLLSNLKRLEDKLNEFPNRKAGIKDTLKYLDEISYEYKNISTSINAQKIF